MIRKLILVALPLLASCGSPAQADEGSAVDRAVGALYAPYQAASPNWDEVRARKIYSRSTEALVKKWEAGLPPDEVEDLADFDWLCECQDWESTAFKFTIAPHGEPQGGRLVVTANVDPGFGESRQTRFTMVKEGDAWLIEDMASGSFPDGLVAALNQAMANRASR